VFTAQAVVAAAMVAGYREYRAQENNEHERRGDNGWGHCVMPPGIIN
jgi:hypothetical protein